MNPWHLQIVKVLCLAVPMFFTKFLIWTFRHCWSNICVLHIQSFYCNSDQWGLPDLLVPSVCLIMLIIVGEPGVASATSNTKTPLSSATTVASTGAAVSPSSTTTANSSSTASVTSSTTAQPSDAVSVATTGTTSASASVASNRITGQSGNTVATTTGDLVTPPGQARTSSSTSRANTASSQSSASSATQQRYDPLGINFDKPRYPSYAVLSNRTASFSAWPPYLRAGREMAAAGFFYAGNTSLLLLILIFKPPKKIKLYQTIFFPKVVFRENL